LRDHNLQLLKTLTRPPAVRPGNESNYCANLTCLSIFFQLYDIAPSFLMLDRRASSENLARICTLSHIGSFNIYPSHSPFPLFIFINRTPYTCINYNLALFHCLFSVCFRPYGEETLTLPRDKVDKVLFNLAGGEISSAITNPFFGVL